MFDSNPCFLYYYYHHHPRLMQVIEKGTVSGWGENNR